MSLRWRLIFWQVGLLIIVLMGFAFVSYRFLANGLVVETDNTLRERAQHVLEAIQTVPNRRVEEVWAPTDEFASPGVYVQILTPAGQVVAHSDNLGRQRLPVNQVLLEQALSGQTFYTTETVDGQPIRLFHQPIIRNEETVGVVQVGQSLQGLRSTLRQLQTIYFVGLVVALILGGGVSWFLLQLGLRPVTQMAQTTYRIAQSGNLNERLLYQGAQDEIGRVVTTFNLMMERLETAFEAQRRFVADTAHELRTPLATILGNVDLLLRYGDDSQRRQPALAAIKREGERTSRLAAGLLLLAQADAGQKLEFRPVELDEVLIEVYEQAQELANGPHVLLERCDPVLILGDPDRLKQVLLNLIDNAFKHTNQSGRVTLSLACEENLAHLTVTDTGCGIPAADLPHIFERFYRGRNGKRSTGLGLSIVKWIVEEHHGDIRVESEPGQGTRFTIRLPIS